MGKIQWFLEPKNPESNGNAAEYFKHLGVGPEDEYSGLMDVEGKRHNCWLIPPGALTRLLKATQTDVDRVKHAFRFFKRDNPNANIRPADFFGELRNDPEIARVRKAIATVTAKKSK